MTRLSDIRARLAAATPGPWVPCHHLKNAECDADCPCPCGYRGGIFGSDQEHMVCEIGSTITPGEEGLETPRYSRPVEIANAHLIFNAPSDLTYTLEHIERLEAALTDLTAFVRGECPGLLDEDSGGDAELALRIDALLSHPEGDGR